MNNFHRCSSKTLLFTASTCPLTFTLRHTCATLPSGSIRKVLLTTPQNSRPYIFFCCHTPYVSLQQFGRCLTLSVSLSSYPKYGPPRSCTAVPLKLGQNPYRVHRIPATFSMHIIIRRIMCTGNMQPVQFVLSCWNRIPKREKKAGTKIYIEYKYLHIYPMFL